MTIEMYEDVMKHLQIDKYRELIIKQDQKITELEKACEETQKLLDKQIEATYKLDQENAELKEKWLQATDEGTSWAHRKSLERENSELKELIKNIIRVTWEEGWNYSLDWKVKAEQFLSEVEK